MFVRIDGCWWWLGWCVRLCDLVVQGDGVVFIRGVVGGVVAGYCLYPAGTGVRVAS